MWNLKSGYGSGVSIYHSAVSSVIAKSKVTSHFSLSTSSRQDILYCKASFISRNKLDGQFNYRIASCTIPNLHNHRDRVTFRILRAKIQSITMLSGLDSWELSRKLQRGVRIKGVAGENRGELLSDEEDDLCPVECVREFKTDEEFLKILGKAKGNNSLVVVDFYRTSCGSCKYIEKGFSKLCKGAGGEDTPVIFLKHNVIDEYDEQSEVAERLRIKAVPLFHFYKNGVLLEAFATRDKERIDEAILKYTSTNQDA